MVVSNWPQMNRVLHLILYGEKLRATQAEWDRRRGRVGMNLREGMRGVYYLCVTLSHWWRSRDGYVSIGMVALTCKDDVNPGDKQVSSLGIHCCFSSKSLL